jgi:crossover junction endodeoxyribonuclease RuvC
MRQIIGIDVGNCGALALLDDSGELLAVEDMPILKDGPAGRPAVSAPLLAAIIVRWRPDRAFVEYVGARPGEGPTGAFSFGRSRGTIEGVLAATGVPATMITAPSWKRCVGIAPGKEGAKDAARAEALRRWPSKGALFARARDDGRAEAALIGVAGLMREASR